MIAVQNLGRAVPFPADYQSISDEAYKKNVIAYRCINLISDCVSRTPWLLYRTGANRTKTEILEHPLLNLLAKPNPLQGGAAFMKSFVAYYVMVGNSYIDAVTPNGNASGKPNELWCYRPDRMQVIPGALGLPAAYVYKVGGKEVRFDVDVIGRSRILHLATFNPTNDWYGMSPIEAAACEVDGLNEMNIWNLSLLRNSARPSGALIVKTDENNGTGTLTKDQREFLNSEIREAYSGAARSGRPMLLEGGMDWKEMGINPKDMDFIQSKSSSSKDIALAFGVPGQMVGVEGSQTYANWKEARLALYEDTVLPLAELIRDALNTWLVPRYGLDLMLDVDKDKIEALTPARAEKWTQVSTAEFLTINEKREALGYGKYQEGADPADQIFIGGGLVPISDAAMPLDAFPTTTPPAPTPGPEDEEGDETEDDVADDLEMGEKRWASIDGKVFNISRASQKSRFWRLYQRKKRAHERALALKVSRAFKAQEEALAQALGQVTRDLYDYVIDRTLQESTPPIIEAMSESLELVGRTFGQDVLNLGKSFGVGIETKDSQSKFDSFLKTFIRSHVAERVALITRATRNRIRSAIRRGISDSEGEGEGELEIADAVKDAYSTSDGRARRIARTEVHNASNTASRAAADSLGIPNMKKEWLSSQDDRSRDGDGESTNHSAMNGVQVELKEKFTVPSEDGPDQMEGPGDPSAPADQVINCRCTTIYVLPEEV